MSEGYEALLRLVMETNGITDRDEGELELLPFLRLQPCHRCGGYTRMIRNAPWLEKLDDSQLERCACWEDADRAWEEGE
jgi:hypothetical protein